MNMSIKASGDGAEPRIRSEVSIPAVHQVTWAEAVITRARDYMLRSVR